MELALTGSPSEWRESKHGVGLRPDAMFAAPRYMLSWCGLVIYPPVSLDATLAQCHLQHLARNVVIAP